MRRALRHRLATGAARRAGSAPARFRRAAGLLAGVAIAAAAGCGRDAPAPVVPPAIPPGIAEVAPAPGAVGVPDLPEIWVRFDRDLDPATVDARRVGLFLDTRRIPARIAWDGVERRVRIEPLAPLALLRTHTVRLDAGLSGRDGAPLGGGFSWQFRTAGVTTPRHPFPPDGAAGESPFVALLWDSSHAEEARVRYLLWIGEDSAAVAARAGRPAAERADPIHVPRGRYRNGATVYWALRAVNDAAGEAVDGPVWRFTVIPEGTPVDSATLILSDWSSYDATLDEHQCFAPTFFVASGRYDTAIRWNLRPLGARRLAHARVSLAPITQGNFFMPTLYTARQDWRACDIHRGGPPHAGEAIGSFARASNGRLVLSGDFLAAWVEGMMRHRGFHGFIPSGPSRVEFSPHFCELTVHWYRVPAEAAEARR